MVIRREGKETGNEAYDIVQKARLEEGAVAAVVEDDEDSDEQPTGKHRQRYGQPPRDRQAEIHQHPEDRVRANRIYELPPSPPHRRFLICLLYTSDAAD